MAGQAPNSTNIARVASGVARSTTIVVHPEYQYWRTEWEKLRDVLAGQREVKHNTTKYLRRMKGQDDEDYATYLDRATFYNMTAQTQNGMLGQVFRRDPIIVNMPDKFKDQIYGKFAKDGSGYVNFTKTVMGEQIGMGRFGVLVDLPEGVHTTAQPFVVGYAAENIIDWEISEVNGFYQPTSVLLREFVRDDKNYPSQNNPWIGEKNPGSIAGKKQTTARQNANQANTNPRARNAKPTVAPASKYLTAFTYTTLYRELCLEQQDDLSWVYVQYVYQDDPRTEPLDSIVPTVRGKPLDFLPFKFFGADSNVADVQKPPLLDIADLNISHYRTYAELEWGRMYTALPVYYAPGKDGDGASEYHIGPNMVWETPEGAGNAPGILEYTGNGLKTLETALSIKEAQIAAIGGRMLPGSNKSSESSDQTVLREANEQSLLLNVIQACAHGMRDVIRWWLMWHDVPLASTENIRFSINQAFLSAPIGARELRAIQMMYDDGVIPVDVFYGYLLKAEVIDADITLAVFVDLLNDPNSFINSPDAQARQRGYADRAQELNQKVTKDQTALEEREVDLQEREVVLMENAPPPLPPAPPKPANAALPARTGGPVPSRPAPKKNKK